MTFFSFTSLKKSKLLASEQEMDTKQNKTGFRLQSPLSKGMAHLNLSQDFYQMLDLSWTPEICEWIYKQFSFNFA